MTKMNRMKERHIMVYRVPMSFDLSRFESFLVTKFILSCVLSISVLIFLIIFVCLLISVPMSSA
jgi:hypothetical protein